MVDLTRELTEFVDALPLIDHHVHGAFAADGSRVRFENSLNEGSTDPLPSFVSGFDSQLGFAIRRWCAPVLDLPKHAAADAYWARRTELGEAEVNRRFLAAAGVSNWVVDTGFATTDLLDPAGMTAVTGAPSHEIVRLEVIAESLIGEGPDDYVTRFRERLEAAIASGAVGTKSVIAYRTGFDVDYARPSDADVAAAASAWHASNVQSGGGSRRAPDRD